MLSELECGVGNQLGDGEGGGVTWEFLVVIFVRSVEPDTILYKCEFF